MVEPGYEQSAASECPVCSVCITGYRSATPERSHRAAAVAGLNGMRSTHCKRSCR
jgi:hypothetical protein